MALESPIINFRLLEKADASTYQSLRLFSYQESPLAFSESYEDELKKDRKAFEEELEVRGHPPESFVLGAFTDQGQLIGFVKFRRDQRSKARHKSMVHAMYVAPKYRGKAIGRNLLLQLLVQVKQLKDLEQIHLWVLLSTAYDASKFYKSCGFEDQGTLVKKDLKIAGQYVDAKYMVKYL